MRYHLEPLLAPEAAMMRRYRAGKIDWAAYAALYIDTLEARDAAQRIDRSTYAEGAVLLCSEATADRCHRRLAAEYLAEHWTGVSVQHF